MRIRIPMWVGIICCVVLNSISTPLYAQDNTISGTVTDAETNESMPGVNIFVKGTTIGTATNQAGEYTLNDIPSEADSLVFSFIGYERQILPISGRSVINVQLQLAIGLLEEMVVVGYGTQSKIAVTSSMSTLKGEDITKVPTNTVSSKLQGRLAGVSVRTISGQPGNELQIRVRGGSSINKSNSPLVIIDGFQRTLKDINPNDIESIDVLKDAAATAIYGSRASNGVVLITTKRGEAGKPRFDFSISYGIQDFNRQYDVLSAEQYLQWWRPRVAVSRYGYSSEMLNGPYPTATGNGINSTWTPRFLGEGEAVPDGWKSMVDPVTGETIIFQDNNLQDLLYRRAEQINYNLSATGGSERVQYAVGFGYTNQEGIAIGTNYDRLNGRVNLDFHVNDRIKISTNADASYSKTNAFNNEEDLFTRGALNAPTIRARFSDGTAGWGTNGTLANPMWVVETRDANNQRIMGTFGVKASWEVLDNLVISGNTFFQGDLGMYDYFEKAHHFSQSRDAEANRNFRTRRQSELLLNYKKTINGHHNFDLLIGFTDLYLNSNNAGLEANGGATDKIPTLNGAPTKLDASTYISDERLISHFARLNYNYDLTYLLSASLRRDGSSKFGSGNRFGYFPSVSAGWVVSNESFFPEGRVLDFLKLRASYGITGNNNINRYEAQGVYSAGYSYGGHAATLATAMPNTALSWEKTTQIDLGFNLGLFDQSRIEITADIYRKRTEDLLFTVQLPRVSGFNSVEQNVGTVEYKGVEFGLTSRNIVGSDFTWTTHFNFAYNINEVIKLPDREGVDKNRINGVVLPDGAGFGGIAEGERLGAIIGYKVDYLIDNEEQAANALYDERARGYDPRTGQLIGVGTKFPGDFEWVDRNGDGRITSLDRFVLGYARPTTTGGFTNILSYKNFTLSIFMDYAAGHSIVDMVHAWMDGNKARRVATTTDVLDAWQEPGDAAVTNQPRSDFHDQQHQNNLRKSDFYATRGDYICLRNVNLTYNVPAEFLKGNLRNLELFVTGNNLYYFTAYEGPNPERGGTIGHQSGRYPPFRTFTIGARIGL